MSRVNDIYGFVADKMFRCRCYNVEVRSCQGG